MYQGVLGLLRGGGVANRVENGWIDGEAARSRQAEMVWRGGGRGTGGEGGGGRGRIAWVWVESGSGFTSSHQSTKQTAPGLPQPTAGVVKAIGE